jgi:hypothetical protein
LFFTFYTGGGALEKLASFSFHIGKTETVNQAMCFCVIYN